MYERCPEELKATCRPSYIPYKGTVVIEQWDDGDPLATMFVDGVDRLSTRMLAVAPGPLAHQVAIVREDADRLNEKAQTRMVIFDAQDRHCGPDILLPAIPLHESHFVGLRADPAHGRLGLTTPFHAGAVPGKGTHLRTMIVDPALPSLSYHDIVPMLANATDGDVDGHGTIAQIDGGPIVYGNQVRDAPEPSDDRVPVLMKATAQQTRPLGWTTADCGTMTPIP